MEKLTPQSAQQIPNEIYQKLSDEEKMEIFVEANNKVLSVGMKQVQKIYSNTDMDPLLIALEFQEYIQANREYCDMLFDKFVIERLKG